MAETASKTVVSLPYQPENGSRWLSARAKSFKPSLIGQISRLAESCNAINLSEGFPDYPAPAFLKQAGVDAIGRDFNQYRYVQEVCELVGRKFSEATGVPVDPTAQVSVCCGQSGAFSSAILAVIGPGDEVLILDPAYETYSACVITAGGVPKFVPLQPPEWRVTRSQLAAAVGPRTKAIVINSPNNPTGRVLCLEELSAIAELCCAHDLLAITDEVYEHLIYDQHQHISLASLPGMRHRTIVTSSISKTFCVTGWRVGWAISPPEICTAIDKLHCKMVDSPPAPFQEAALAALGSPPEYYQQLTEEYAGKRDAVCRLLEEAGLEIPCKPEGGMFAFARIPSSYLGSDVDFVKKLIKEAGIAVVPGSNFFHTDSEAYRMHQPPLGRELPQKAGNGAIAHSHSPEGDPRIQDRGGNGLARKGPRGSAAVVEEFDGQWCSSQSGRGLSEIVECRSQEAADLRGQDDKGHPSIPSRSCTHVAGLKVSHPSGSHMALQANGHEIPHNHKESWVYTGRYVRVAFCKSSHTLNSAAMAMKRFIGVHHDGHMTT